MKKQESVRTGIRVKHLQSKRYTESQHSDIDELNKYLEELDFSTTKLQNEEVPPNLNKKQIGDYKPQSFNSNLTSNMKPIPIKMDTQEPLRTLENKPSLGGFARHLENRQIGPSLTTKQMEMQPNNQIGQPVHQTVQIQQPSNQFTQQSPTKQPLQNKPTVNLYSQQLAQSPHFGMQSQGSVQNMQTANEFNRQQSIQYGQPPINQIPTFTQMQSFQQNQPQQLQNKPSFQQFSQAQQIQIPQQQQQAPQKQISPQQQLQIPQQPQVPQQQNIMQPITQQQTTIQKPSLQSTQPSQTMQQSIRTEQRDNPMFVSLRDPNIKTDISNGDAEIYKRVQSMQKQIEHLTQMVHEKDKREELNDMRIEEIMKLRDIDNQRKDAEISKHLNKIDELLNDVQSKQKTIEQLRYQLLRSNNKTVGEVRQSGYEREIEIRKNQMKRDRPKANSQFEVKWSTQKQEEEYLSPLMINAKKQSRLTIEDSKHFRFQDLRDMSDLQF